MKVGTEHHSYGRVLSFVAPFLYDAPAFAHQSVWEFPKIRGTLFWGPYNKDPTI